MHRRNPKGFAQVPTRVARDPSLSVQARHLYTILISYAWQDGETFVSQTTLAQNMGFSDRYSVIPYVRELEHAGLIRTRHRPGRSNVYVFPTDHTHQWPTDHTTKKQPLRENLETGNGSHTTSTPVPPPVGTNEESNTSGLDTTGKEQTHRTCRVEIPGRARYLRLARRAASEPATLLSRDISELRRVLLDDQGGPCRLHLRIDCLRCAELEKRLRAELNARLEVP